MHRGSFFEFQWFHCLAQGTYLGRDSGKKVNSTDGAQTLKAAFIKLALSLPYISRIKEMRVGIRSGRVKRT